MINGREVFLCRGLGWQDRALIHHLWDSEWPFGPLGSVDCKSTSSLLGTESRIKLGPSGFSLVSYF